LAKSRQPVIRCLGAPFVGLDFLSFAIVMRTHDRRIGVSENDRRWCFDGFATRRVRTGFALVCCDREVMSWWR
jgi:hypothetical protein